VHIERYLADGPGASEPLAVCEALFGVTDATVRDAGVVIALPPLKATHLEHVLRTGDYDRELESRKRVAVYARADVRLAECFQKLFWKLGVEVALCDYLDVDEQSTPFIVFVGWEHVVHLDGVADLGLDAQRIVPLEGGFELDGHTYPAPAANHAVLVEPCISLVPGRSTRAVVIGGSTAAGTESIAAHVKERGWGELVRLVAEVSPSSLVLWVREEGTRTVRPAQLLPR
jgi:hypothetical protein